VKFKITYDINSKSKDVLITTEPCCAVLEMLIDVNILSFSLTSVSLPIG
jgi:hypothetical protein